MSFHSRRRCITVGSGALLGAVGLMLALAPAGLASTYVANELGDHVPGACSPSDCTLREAITKANTHGGRDTVVLRGGKVYKLSQANVAGDEDANSSGDLDVLESLTIRSSSKKAATVDADGIDRVFQVGPTAAASATFKRVTIRGGALSGGTEHGGGIDSEFGGTLKLIRSAVIGNTTDDEGGGIAADGGTLKLVRSVVAHNSATGPANNAGGIEGEPGTTENEVISISRSRIVDNHAAENAGAIYSYNKLTIDRSTLSGNTAGGSGGAIYDGSGTVTVKNSTLSHNIAGADGGALDVLDTATLLNDTLTKNRAARGGAIAGDGATTNLNAVTIAGNHAATDGGGIDEVSGVINLTNSLIALNSNGTGLGPDCHNDDFAGIESGGQNLIGDTTDCTGIFSSAVHDILDVNPRIGPLADNGGPTETIALRRHSKAINHAGDDAPSRDQRGLKRHNPDIGAFERR